MPTSARTDHERILVKWRGDVGTAPYKSIFSAFTSQKKSSGAAAAFQGHIYIS